VIDIIIMTIVNLVFVIFILGLRLFLVAQAAAAPLQGRPGWDGQSLATTR
jgi:hypothetical protein